MSRKVFTSLEDAFVYYTDCQVATFFEYVCRKSQSKSSVSRQKGITEGMISEIMVLPEEPKKRAVIDRYKRALEQWDIYHNNCKGEIALPGDRE